MEIKIIKEEVQKCQVGDVLSLGNPYKITHYLLVDHFNQDSLGAINLNTGTLEHLASGNAGFDPIINMILDETEWDEWTIIPKDRVKMTLDCRNNIPSSGKRLF